MTPDEFWAVALPYANQAHDATNVLQSVILAQWAAETGYGGWDWSPGNNPGNVGSFDGQPVNVFPSLAVGVEAYIQCMKNGYYNRVMAAFGYVNQSLALGESPWASAKYIAPGSSVPGSILIEIVQEFNLTRFDASDPNHQAPPPPPKPTPPPEVDVDLDTHDPLTGGLWLTDENGALYAVFGSPYIMGANLNTHPQWQAGEAESKGQNPCVGLAYWGIPGKTDGICFFTKPANGKGGIAGTPYSSYRFKRDGTPV